jgi:large subunit ribosomal protein L15
MPHSKRKTRKKRGHRTVGWGRVGQHRGSGMRGGYGRAGMHKHKWMYTLKYEPDHFGRRGFKSIHEEVKTMNVGELEELFGKISRTEAPSEPPTLDLSEEGCSKLLGAGRISRPLIVKIEKASKMAIDKVRAAGGEVLTTEEER